MPVLEKNIIILGAANMADDDVSTTGGGTGTLASAAKKLSFVSLGSNAQVKGVAEAAATLVITVTGRDSTGAVVTDAITLNGTTYAQAGSPKTFQRIMKAVKGAQISGNNACAIMSATLANSGTAQAAGADTLTLAAGASATDDFYKGMVLRIATSTLGTYQLREIIKYVGSTKVATVRDWTTTPTGTITYEVAEGCVFEKTGSPSIEIMEVRRIFYNAAANATGGAAVALYEKGFICNLNTATALTSAVVKEVSGGAASSISFALESTLNGSDSVANRTTAPAAGYTFDSADKNVANSQNLSVFGSNGFQGIWFKLDLAAGASAADTFYGVQVVGQST